ncbi:hypothetical protein PSN45_003722 [Yamadazyma tenuis]|uniref:Uncharacterized protein n=1 Tax=Candida tenuis (strain ATCC 10573 / BCRC 21748 / CBS 615 / JCM 9827 / NBRC 10315 / NRRL Y-1498 / VKM Y-70) TaxID=590646 RepID=G3B3H8_CANTC|nr:uncharacterized protein CANTEDRAFT_114214 [Yamadazyma tenuis ATCC 10573]XP_006686712.1 uncharacterized protein CANTEDRAFT_114214 [Yamadazyma tenuis ATCC 10573]EGV64397.1 hypothetical protein CANTEDRAFT_114214 [Yamadazyma tenuis ATCC 10573]EGV64398.1 hypothetical protein CANTEDRAFT_114214 [Yamadazyma tenuis ATCC 10573]WEJ96186.1 hypothetical protein PSN45_003722 [Yamadazyma tenuis]
MAHPDASIKSIYSGKVNFSSSYDADPPEFDSDSQLDDSLSRLSNESLSSRNLKIFNVNSDISQNDLFNDSSSDGESNGDGNLSVPSPSLSRNSTTSCLSTTATKDGIEGRKFHRKGPKAYSNHIISSMIKTTTVKSVRVSSADRVPSEKTLNGNTDVKGSKVTSIHIDTSPQQSPAGGRGSPTPMAQGAYSYSEVSFKTTDAEFEGFGGHEQPALPPFYKQPDMSLWSKIDMLNPDT